MTAPDQAPETYQQWLACLCYMQNCPGDQHVHDLIMQGHFQGQVSETFKARLSETTGIMLTHFFRRFLRDMDRILADRELEMAGLLAVRFRKKVVKCLFYRDLTFLEPSFIGTLDEGFCPQIQSFWKDFLFHFREAARESVGTEMEDVLLEMSRVRII